MEWQPHRGESTCAVPPPPPRPLHPGARHPRPFPTPQQGSMYTGVPLPGVHGDDRATYMFAQERMQAEAHAMRYESGATIHPQSTPAFFGGPASSSALSSLSRVVSAHPASALFLPSPSDPDQPSAPSKKRPRQQHSQQPHPRTQDATQRWLKGVSMTLRIQFTRQLEETISITSLRILALSASLKDAEARLTAEEQKNAVLKQKALMAAQAKDKASAERQTLRCDLAKISTKLSSQAEEVKHAKDEAERYNELMVNLARENDQLKTEKGQQEAELERLTALLERQAPNAQEISKVSELQQALSEAKADVERLTHELATSQQQPPQQQQQQQRRASNDKRYEALLSRITKLEKDKETLQDIREQEEAEWKAKWNSWAEKWKSTQKYTTEKENEVYRLKELVRTLEAAQTSAAPKADESSAALSSLHDQLVRTIQQHGPLGGVIDAKQFGTISETDIESKFQLGKGRSPTAEELRDAHKSLNEALRDTSLDPVFQRVGSQLTVKDQRGAAAFFREIQTRFGMPCVGLWSKALWQLQTHKTTSREPITLLWDIERKSSLSTVEALSKLLLLHVSPLSSTERPT